MQDPQVQLWCEDEAHFQRHGSLIRMWAPQGRQPHWLAHSCCEKVAFLGALNLKTGYLETQETSTFNAHTFQDCIPQLLQVTRDYICLMLDNARWDRAQTRATSSPAYATVCP